MIAFLFPFWSLILILIWYILVLQASGYTVMKLVLNYNNIVKLYTEELVVSRLLDFIEE